MSDSVADTEHCISNSKAMEPSNSSSKNDPEPSAPVINMSFPSRSVHLSTKERLLLRKQALKIKEPVVVIGIVFSYTFFLPIFIVLGCRARWGDVPL